MFAIIDIKGSQERVEKGSILLVPYMADKMPGDTIDLVDVMLYADGDDVQLGTPLLEGISCSAKIVEHTRAAKVIAFKKKRRTGYQRKIGHRQDHTKIEILSLNK
jgi:large subunit ribosomal protein L21